MEGKMDVIKHTEIIEREYRNNDKASDAIGEDGVSEVDKGI